VEYVGERHALHFKAALDEYYDVTVNWPSVNYVGQQQAAATEATNNDIDQLLGYIATYPANGITYRASNMVIAAHSDAAYLNVSKARSRAGAHSMLAKDVPVPSYNIPVLTVARIIKCVMSSAAEAELAGLYICANEMIPLCQALVEMGWPSQDLPSSVTTPPQLESPTKPSFHARQSQWT